MSTQPGWKDEKMDALIGGLLRAGVTISALTVLAGAVLYLARHGDGAASYGVFRGEPPQYSTVAGVLRQVVRLRGRGIIQLGLLLLIATPVARVAFSIFGFLLQRDRLYAGVASIVLLILLYSLFFS